MNTTFNLKSKNATVNSKDRIKDTTSYLERRDHILSQPMCYREVEVKDIEAIDDKHYKVAGLTVEVLPEVAKRLDTITGVKNYQVEQVKDFYGNGGVANFRNYMSRSVKDRKKVVLQADPATGKVVAVIPIGDHMILPHQFFEFADMFMDRNSYLPYNLQYDNNQIGLYLESAHPQFQSLLPGDDITANGILLNWNPGQISISNFYIRLLCTNGMIRFINASVARTDNVLPETLAPILELPDYKEFMNHNLLQLRELVGEAASCTASMRELKYAKNILLDHGVDGDVAEGIVPYQTMCKEYADAGQTITAKNAAIAESKQNVWQLYNSLTHFATHTDIWSQHDTRRTGILNRSMDFLERNRDLVPRLTLK